MAEVTAQSVKNLRDMTGAGMMDCKKALVENDGDVEKAKDWLREKGLAKSASRVGREAREGIVESYVHKSSGIAKLGVLVELNCESDFVAKTDDFQALAREIALQVAGKAPLYVRKEDVPKDVLDRETAIFRNQVEGKPENIVEKIIAGKLEAFYKEVCLLEQPWIRDEKGKQTIGEMIHEAIAKMGENITVSRFARFQVGETSSTSASNGHHE
ncbi:MAG: translation elongation factor Ts [Candidatus Dormibacteria bacterium]